MCYQASDTIGEWFRWPDYFRMSSVERAITFGGTLALLVYLAIVVGNSNAPNAVAAAAAVVSRGARTIEARRRNQNQ